MTDPRDHDQTWHQLELILSPNFTRSERGDLENIINVVGGLRHRYEADARRAAQRLSEQAIVLSVVRVYHTKKAQYVWKNGSGEDLR